MVINHDPAGNINSIVCHVVGPDGGEVRTDELMAETAQVLTDALGIDHDAAFDGNVKMGVARTSIGVGYTFANGPLFYSLSPRNAVPENAKWVAHKPGYGYRDILVMPRKGPAVNGFGYPPIEGADFAQLKSLLDGFEVMAEVPGEQMLFRRKADDHTDYVYCELKDGKQVSLIEAFVKSAAEGVDVLKLDKDLWTTLTNFKYKECNPEEAVTFLNSKQPTYQVDYSCTIGYGKYYLPVNVGGKRDRLLIWATEPVQKKL